ncbi:hypothetical protein D8821_10495 [Streptococcus gordonii]|uniref:DUF1642 domain-containing protein n=1 Tax=Streptococcus gordonii TaxID=1302 RepID=UPI000F67D7F1|nr:DUF1642 domain-containing protein [Streptococcus gordonii]RSJ32876.1 hypothetical protein D8821_10495 [Streptococcus gordonii]
MSKKELVGTLMERMQKFGYFPSFTNVKIFIREYEKLTKSEPQKPVIPQFVAEIIEYYKRNNATLYDALGEKNFNKQYSEWLLNEQNAYDKVARAWLDGYEVEKEKRYRVSVKNVLTRQGSLNRNKKSGRFIFSNPEENSLYDTKFTRKELEEAGFGWVFDCEGVEVKEVE